MSSRNYLSWIDDSVLLESLDNTLKKGREAAKSPSNKFNKNIIDPFSAIFEFASFGLDYDSWKQAETNRQAQKSLQNHVGTFHQLILGSCDGWENLGTGLVVDIRNTEKKIIAEIKNKYNTVSGAKLIDEYKKLEDEVSNRNSSHNGFTAYYVTIIAKGKFNKEFTPSDNKKSGNKAPMNKNIRIIDGATFYHMVTGYENALSDLYKVIPKIMTEEFEIKMPDETVLDDLFKLAYK